MNDDIMVSIICNVFNHEMYIRDALDSFILQKTNFKFEILIHDDASTDSTKEIIKEYELKYPNLIKPIYQFENKYSKKISIFWNYQFPRVRGKYIALCEGDDYWIDEYKLQKQYDFMEKNSLYNMCSHNSYVVNAEKKEIIGKIETSKNNSVISTFDTIAKGGGGFATNSLFFRKKIIENAPTILKEFTLDYFLQIYGSLNNGIYNFSDYMSSYRELSNSSWSKKMSKNISKLIEHIKKVNSYLVKWDLYSNGKYKKAFYRHIKKNKKYIFKLKLRKVLGL